MKVKVSTNVTGESNSQKAGRGVRWGTQWTKNRDLFMCLLTSLMLSDPEHHNKTFEIINSFESVKVQFSLKISFQSFWVINYSTFPTLPKTIHFDSLSWWVSFFLFFLFPRNFGLIQDIRTPKCGEVRLVLRLGPVRSPLCRCLQAPGPHHLPSSPICERRETRAPLL